MLEFKRETLNEIRPDIEDNLVHHNEDMVKTMGQLMVVDWEMYRVLENLDLLYGISARSEGEFIGYMVFLLEKSLNYNTRSAISHVTYIHPKRRCKSVLSKMVRAAEKMLKKAGVDIISYAVRPECDYSMALTHMGFRLSDKIYTKKL